MPKLPNLAIVNVFALAHVSFFLGGYLFKN